MTGPGDTIVRSAEQTFPIKDVRDRTIMYRRMTALDRLRLLKAAGPELSRNESWLGMAALVMTVTEIDGVPRVAPMNEKMIEAAVAELGDDGLQAISDHLVHMGDGALFAGPAASGNAAGTPN